ncbi:MAG: hypothetical protein ACYTGB_13255 [Planctomycetota bacterium]|jgi:hypothetical protein
MTDPIAPTAPPPAARAEEWAYASGRVAALEGLLLGRDSLERLAEADSPAAVSAALGESPLRVELTEVGEAAAAAELISAYYARARASLEADFPYPALFELVALPARFAGMKERARRLLAAGGSPGGAAAEVRAEILEDFDEEGEAAAGLDLLLASTGEGGDAGSSQVFDLLLDSSRLLESLRLAGRVGDTEVESHAVDEVTVRAALLLWRSRLVSGEDPEAPDRELISRFFLRGALAGGTAAKLWGLPLPAWAEVLAAELHPSLGEAAFGAGDGESLNPWERAALDWLTARARDMRGAAFGVGRVYSYAWALGVEEHNVRLAVVGRLRGVASSAVRGLLWEACA